MFRHQFRLFSVALFLVGSGTVVRADALNCDRLTTDALTMICGNRALSDLASLAGDIGDTVGLDLRYNDVTGTDDMYQRFGRLLRALMVSDMDQLEIRQQGWVVEYDQASRILFIKPSDSQLQDMMIVFGTDNSVSYVAMEHYDDAGRYQYQLNGTVLEIYSRFSPGSFFDKYRYQDGCWRLIGEDNLWRDEDPDERSINHLTGQAEFRYRDGTRVSRTFDPKVICLGDHFSSFEIEYHQD
ncbi:MAG: hypothetical protein ACSHW1_20800 [Yoonia sp.]|uniref:hypothetical protein n=1 Tax=Yoonia sp. TaxID=2212373 RepID=UPI003EF216EA